MNLPTIEVYSDLLCPWAYLATYRLRKLWPAYTGRLRLEWRALSLEYINRSPAPKPVLDAERALIAQIEPELPIGPWAAPDWQWPTTFWPAFEALACAQAQGDAAAFALSWALRHAFFAESRNVSLRHELLALALQISAEAPLDPSQLEHDWDSGRYKAGVIAESRHGWHTLKVGGSPTLVLPDGRQFSNPASGDADIDEEIGLVRSYTPFAGDPLAAYRTLLDAALS